jgi:DNA-directed RNA polymerase specialized sigma24 family protein
VAELGGPPGGRSTTRHPPATDQWIDPDLVTAIGRLPSGQREVLVLAALGELRPAEIAKVLGKAASTVRGQLSRARTTLRRVLASPAARLGYPKQVNLRR